MLLISKPILDVRRRTPPIPLAFYYKVETNFSLFLQNCKVTQILVLFAVTYRKNTDLGIGSEIWYFSPNPAAFPIDRGRQAADRFAGSVD